MVSQLWIWIWQTRLERQIPLCDQLIIPQLNYRVFFCDWCPPKKSKFGQQKIWHLKTSSKIPKLSLLMVGTGIECWWKVINCKATFTRLKCQELKGGSIAVIIDLQTSKQIRRSEWNAAFKLVFAEIKLKSIEMIDSSHLSEMLCPNLKCQKRVLYPCNQCFNLVI